MYTHVHIPVTILCIVGYTTGAGWWGGGGDGGWCNKSFVVICHRTCTRGTYDEGKTRLIIGQSSRPDHPPPYDQHMCVTFPQCNKIHTTTYCSSDWLAWILMLSCHCWTSRVGLISDEWILGNPIVWDIHFILCTHVHGLVETLVHVSLHRHRHTDTQTHTHTHWHLRSQSKVPFGTQCSQMEYLHMYTHTCAHLTTYPPTAHRHT